MKGSRYHTRKKAGRGTAGPPRSVDEIIREARQTATSGYREQSLKVHGLICAKCAREFDYADRHLLTVPRTRTLIGSRAFRVAGPVVWNSLPADLRSTDLSLSSFKSHLKTVLFINAFNDVDVAN